MLATPTHAANVLPQRRTPPIFIAPARIIRLPAKGKTAKTRKMQLSFRLRDGYTDRHPICGSPGQGGLVRGGSGLLAAGLVLMTTGSLPVVGFQEPARGSAASEPASGRAFLAQYCVTC